MRRVTCSSRCGPRRNPVAGWGSRLHVRLLSSMVGRSSASWKLSRAPSFAWCCRSWRHSLRYGLMPRKIPQILTVDDDAVTCELLCEVFAREGFNAVFANSGEAALAEVERQRPDLLLSDIRMKTRLDGLSLLEIVRREYPAVPVVLMTAFGSIETAVRAVKEGAFDYISKPFNIDELVAIVRRALANGTGKQVASDLDDEEEWSSGLIGRTPPMLEIYKMIARVSDSRAAVLITGESGTGKELVARAIHNHGSRASERFVAVNCGALTETLLESELFGHVKGSFTGAIANKRGIFE